jgi:hypothetical protein
MRPANIVTMVIVALWSGLFIMGRGLAYGVYTHGVGVFPNSGQIDYYVLFPICMAALLTLVAWACNVFSRPSSKLWSSILLAFSVLSFGTLFPYLFFYTGGV